MKQEDSVPELRFPAGMRVLLVDDDNTCLKLTNNLLSKCQYNVTTTNRAKDALKLLKNHRNRFDIVISDVEMPDMDGIKLLQLISLEMNIPVIMLSSYSDTKRVMQGIKNGACDYLVKPVRIQELQNIWQHVVRRNKSITLRKPSPSAVVPPSSASNAGPSNRFKTRSPENSSGDDDNNNDDDDDDEHDDSGRENDDPTHQKKPRLFWSVELHQKFVDAVDALGIEKAFPKKILDLMNVEGLTREKVASHLQKYRLYLKKVSTQSNQTSSKISAYEDAHIGPLGGGYGVFRSLAGSTGKFPGYNPPLSHPQMYGRLNAAAGLSIRSLASSPMLQNATPSFPPMPNFEPQNSNAALFQGFPPNQQNTNAFMYQLPQHNTNDFANKSSSNMGVLDGINGSASNLIDTYSRWGTSQPFQPNPFTSSTTTNNNVSGDAPIIAPNAETQMKTNPLDYLCVDNTKGDAERQQQDCLNGGSVGHSFSFSQIWQDHNLDSCMSGAGVGVSSSQIPAVGSADHTNISTDPNMKVDDFLIDDPKLVGGLEDIVGRFLKQDNNETGQMGDDFELDSATL